MTLPMTEIQRRAANFSWNRKWSILALDVGLGKSRVSLEIANLAKDPYLVVCPAYLIKNWHNEIKKWLGNSGPDHLIISYDKVQKESFGKLSRYKTIILDEAHYIKSMKAKRTQFIHTMFSELQPERGVLLTGTPIKNRVHELYSLLALTEYNKEHSLFLDKFPEDISFADHFSHRMEFDMPVGRRTIKVVNWKGLKNEEELHKWTKPKMLRIKNNFPDPIINDVFLGEKPIPGLTEAFVQWQKDSGGVAPNIKAEAAEMTVPMTLKHVETVAENTDRPILIYSDHVKATELMAEKLKCPGITGKVSAEVRGKLAEEFQEGRHKFLCATIGSFSTGVTLTKANQIILNDLPWVPGDLEQVIGRVNRLGMTDPCVIHRMILSDQVEYILKTLDEKSKVIERTYEQK